MEDQVFRDPSVKQAEAWRVAYRDRVCAPTFNSKGAAEAYLDMLYRGARQPEYRGKEVS